MLVHQLVCCLTQEMWMGRLLNRAYEIRQAADYDGDSVELSDATDMVKEAETFVAAMRHKFIHE
ncbi:MAG: hypothetical protein V4695_00075 [Pseudomonadota bacterium]